MQTTSVTLKHLPLLHSLAWKVNCMTDYNDVDDLFGEACLAAIKCIEKFDPNKGKISTFLYAAIKNHLLTYVSAQAQFVQADVLKERHVTRKLPDISTLFESKIYGFSSNTRRLYKMILNDPEKFLQMNKQNLTEYLRTVGWSWRTIRNTFTEIKQALN